MEKKLADSASPTDQEADYLMDMFEIYMNDIFTDDQRAQVKFIAAKMYDYGLEGKYEDK